METPIRTASPTSKPVRGRPPDEELVVLADDVGALATVEVPELELDVEDDVGVPELELDPDEELPELELEPLELDPEPELELPEPDELPDFLPPEPLNGSVYCWSPADGPEASAIAGPTTANATRASSRQISARVKRKARVLQLLASS